MCQEQPRPRQMAQLELLEPTGAAAAAAPATCRALPAAGGRRPGSRRARSPAARRARRACHALPRAPQALVDFPGQTRRVVSFKRLALTDYTVDIPRLAKKAVLKKALEEAGAWAWRGAAVCCGACRGCA